AAARFGARSRNSRNLSVMMKPSRARAMAGANKSAQGSAPCAAWASAARRMLEGTPTLRPDSTASIKGNGRPSWPRNQSGAAAAGAVSRPSRASIVPSAEWCSRNPRSEEHTSELQSRENLVCRLLLEKKKQEIDDTRNRAQSDAPDG